MTLADLLPSAGPQLAVHANGLDVSGEQLRVRAEQVAAALRDAGITAGSPVGVLLPNSADGVATLFAVWLARGVVVPLNPRATDTESRRVLGSVGVAGVVTTEEHAPRVASRTHVVLRRDASIAVTRVESDRQAAHHDSGVAIVSFTSGTTGDPKPVPLLHTHVLEGLDQVLATVRVKPGGGPPMPNLVPVPLSVWAGIYQVLFAFRVGAPVVVMDRFDTTEFAALVQRFTIKSTVLPPAAMVMLADDDSITTLAPLKYVRSISAPLSPLQARRFRDRFGISVLNGYGQTELGGEVVGWSAADTKTFGDDKLGSVGRQHAGVEVTTDEATGEILVRIPGRIDEWHHTGDVGRIDDDGFVWIEGRVSDMINRGGLKVHPDEVEEVLRLSPAVRDAAVVGIADDRLGEVPVAFIVEGAGTNDRALEALCREHLAPYKVPVRFVRVDVLPRNDVGKVIKRELVDGLNGSAPR